MNEKINITKMDGTNQEVEVICFLENKNTNKKYLYYTLNEIVGSEPNSTVKIYVDKIKQNDDLLDAPISADDWGILKGYMGDALKGISNPDIVYLPLQELGSPVCVSERAIAMPTSYDYIAKQRTAYLDSIANMAPQVPVVEEQPVVQETTPFVDPITAPSFSPDPVSFNQEPMVSNEPMVSAPTVEPKPFVEPTAVEENITPAIEPQAEVQASQETAGENTIKMEPIDITAIEAKYDEMINDIAKLKEKEIEAANRYNATLKLSGMHMDQHANYVQNDLKDNAVSNGSTQSTVAPAISAPTLEETSVMSSNASIEPVPVTPVVPEPTPITPQEIETNWFDMPANN